jgi:hypothetical protein
VAAPARHFGAIAPYLRLSAVEIRHFGAIALF